MESIEIELTREQCGELSGLQVKLMQMLEPDKQGCILAQVFPDQGIMRVKVFDHVIARQLAAILPPVEVRR